MENKPIKFRYDGGTIVAENVEDPTDNFIWDKRVLNEGINVPEANIAMVLGGSGSFREHTQRLGRILHEKEGKFATLYGIMSKDTLEKGISQRRRRKPKQKKPDTEIQPQFNNLEGV